MRFGMRRKAKGNAHAQGLPSEDAGPNSPAISNRFPTIARDNPRGETRQRPLLCHLLRRWNRGLGGMAKGQPSSLKIPVGMPSMLAVFLRCQ